MKLWVAHRNKKKLNNRGSSIVLVIVAMAFIGILAAMVMWMSYMNYYMKATDMKATDNFYSAEMVVEQMKTGLTTEASACMSDAYGKTLQKYSQYTPEERQSYFATEMITSLKNKFVGASLNQYDIEVLKGYVDTVLKSTGGGAPGAVITCETDAASASMSVSDNSIVLKDVNVEYTDSNKMVSIIRTDFRIDVPVMDFTDSDTLPDLFDYSLIAGETLGGNSTGNISIEGNIYGGMGEVKADGSVGDESVILTGNSRWEISGSDRIVAGKSVVLKGPSAALLTDANSNFWVNGLLLEGNSSRLELRGRNYVADDLTVNGADAVVTLSNQYYGYGTDVLGDGSDSSAVLVNGKGASLDLTGLDRLWIGGRSYIGTKSVEYTTAAGIVAGNNKNVPMSESIAVRGNQIAYLVPSECIAVKDGVSLASKNPMTYAEYADVVHTNLTNADFKEVDFDRTIPETGEPVSTYTTNFQKIFAQGLGGEGLVYYYLVMDDTSAELFFQNYYGVQSEKLNRYTDVYADGILTGAASTYTRIDIQGNWLTKNGSAVSVNAPTASDDTALAAESVNYSNTFTALNKKLITNLGALSVEELGRPLYENIIATSEVNACVAAGGTVTCERTQSVGDTLVGVVSRADSYTYDGDTAGKKTRLIISAGDVVLNKPFDGTVIAAGDITIRPGADITHDEDTKKDIAILLQADITAGSSTKKLYELLRDGSGYLLIGVGGSGADPSENRVELNEVVTYENWSKR